MKEIRIGDKKRFLHQVQHAQKGKKVEVVRANEAYLLSNYYGLPVIVDERIPKNRAVLIGEKGEVLKIFNI